MFQKLASNHRSEPKGDKDNLPVERVFLRLGSILAEIANAAAQGEINNDTEKEMSHGQAPVQDAPAAGNEGDNSHE